MTVQPLRQWGTIERGLLAGIVLLCAIYAVAAVIVRPSVGVDPAYGLRVYQSMQAGARWNHRIEPDASDISRDTANFIAMFSPGQYLVPAPLMDAGLSMGVALMLVSIGVTFLGLFGWYQFYRVLGHEPRESLLACSILAASRSVNHAFVGFWLLQGRSRGAPAMEP